MSGPASAWMPFYVGDYLGDTQRLTTEQHGAYLLLMLDYWRNGPPPADDTVFQQITKLDKAGWKRCKLALERMFQPADGYWHHKRIDRELKNASSNSERRSSKAKAAAQARWENAPSNAKGNATSMPGALLVECPPQSPSPKEGSVTNVTGADAPQIDSDKIFWDNAKAFLRAEVKGDPGSVIGKWIKLHGKAETITAIGRAQVERPVKAVPFIEGCFKQQARQAVSEYGPC